MVESNNSLSNVHLGCVHWSTGLVGHGYDCPYDRLLTQRVNMCFQRISPPECFNDRQEHKGKHGTPHKYMWQVSKKGGYIDILKTRHRLMVSDNSQDLPQQVSPVVIGDSHSRIQQRVLTGETDLSCQVACFLGWKADKDDTHIIWPRPLHVMCSRWQRHSSRRRGGGQR